MKKKKRIYVREHQPTYHLSNLSSKRNAATLSTQLHYAQRQLFVPDWISKRDTLFPSPSYIWRSNREESSPFRHSISANCARDAVLPPSESSRLLLLLHPHILSSSRLSVRPARPWIREDGTREKRQFLRGAPLFDPPFRWDTMPAYTINCSQANRSLCDASKFSLRWGTRFLRLGSNEMKNVVGTGVFCEYSFVSDSFRLKFRNELYVNSFA